MRFLPFLLLPLLFMFRYATGQSRTITGRILAIEVTCSDRKSISPSDTIPFAAASVLLLDDSGSIQKNAPGSVTDADGWFSVRIAVGQSSRYKYLKIIDTYGGSVLPDIIAIPEQTDSMGTIIIRIAEDTATKKTTSQKVNPNSHTGKPAIYLYPERPTDVTIKNKYTGTIGTTYPEYGDGWTVHAQPDGQLLNLKDNRTYEYLFWDGTCHYPPEHFILKDGFVVKKEETVAFLRGKLELTGLNNKEINDFIVYWLPRLREYPCNFIRFRVNDDIDHTSVLTVTPEPDSRIRIFMEFQPVDPDFRIQEQLLHRYPRKGFTLVEWGGAKLEEPFIVQ